MITKKAEPDTRAGGTRIQSVSRAARVLLAVAANDEGLTVKEVASHFNLSTPTAYHLLNTLVYEGLLHKDERKHYSLGPRASTLSDAYNRRNVVPFNYETALRDLADETGETAYLSAWRNGAISVLASVEGSQAVRVAGLTTGYTDNIHARASGKLLLAFAPPALRESLLQNTVFTSITPHTIVTRAALDRELEQIREEGLARDRQEFREGVECISAPIRENGMVVACFTLSCPAERFTARQEQITQALLRSTQLVSETRQAST